MTIQFKRDLYAMLQALRGILEECDKQGVDSTGYIHYVEAFKVDQVRVPYALVMRHLEDEAKKHGDFRYLAMEGNDDTGSRGAVSL